MLSAKRLVPRRLETKVAGRKNIVSTAMVLIAALSCRASWAIKALCSAIRWLARLSLLARRL